MAKRANKKMRDNVVNHTKIGGVTEFSLSFEVTGPTYKKAAAAEEEIIIRGPIHNFTMGELNITVSMRISHKENGSEMITGGKEKPVRKGLYPKYTR